MENNTEKTITETKETKEVNLDTDDKADFYEIRIKILEKEIFSIGFNSTLVNTEWITIGTLIVLFTIIFLSTYGAKLIDFIKGIN